MGELLDRDEWNARRIAELERALATAIGEWRGWLDAADSAGWPYHQDDRARLRECSRVLRGEG